jgi:hypothetical protein
METVAAISLALGVAWASGINLYAAVLVLGILANTGHAVLPPALEVLQDPLVLGVAGIMYFLEFVADKTPGVDSGWDAIHTFIRIPAGAIMAAGVAEGMEVNQAVEFAAILLAGIGGGAMAATSHFTKAGSRVLINTSPEPVTNWTASVAEDIAVVAGLWTALNYPSVFVVLMLLFVLFAIWILPKIWRAIKIVARKIRGWLRGDSDNIGVTERARRKEALPKPTGDEPGD